MPLEDRRHLYARIQRQTPTCDCCKKREYRSGADVADRYHVPAVIARDRRGGFCDGRRNNERNRKVNQERV
jgi:hypothetical protein